MTVEDDFLQVVDLQTCMEIHCATMIVCSA